MCEGARHHFDRKGVIVAARDQVSTEKALELAIESGAEDVHEAEDEEEKPILQVTVNTEIHVLLLIRGKKF